MTFYSFRTILHPIWLVETVIVNGNIVYEEGHTTQFDAMSLLAEARELGADARRQAESGMNRLNPLAPYMWQVYINLAGTDR